MRKLKYTGGLGNGADVNGTAVRKGETIDVEDGDQAADMLATGDWELVEGSQPRRSKAAREAEVAEADVPPAKGG